jgi:aminoglycoside 6'-N-acetyltransferase I
MKILALTSADDKNWLQLRQALWVDTMTREHKEEMRSFLAEPERFCQFICKSNEGQVLGFVEASIRMDYVNGTDHSPVAFLEGLYVKPEARRNGVARALLKTVADWGKTAGCRELASDASIQNRTSHAVHKSLGFAETERVVYFNKRLK